ncbi:intermembrane lipid transfer protein VPS13A isoform X2 [Notamacropus eugenii]|uniref:intermembrane lipid transfer protein VPS13A isoform X2 n=1 Tax=Notamacropus eugenii TaxID=9315 RepID=UPI003B684CE8
MVFESVVVDVLNRFLGDYVVNLDTSQLTLGIWGGAVALKNLQIKETALSELDVPFKVKAGHIGKLDLVIPWTNLYTQPVEAVLDGIYLIVVPSTTFKYDAEKEEKYLFEMKQSELKRIEDAKQKMANKGNPQEEKQDSFSEKLISHIIKNLQLKISNIHVRYEDDVTNRKKPLSCGISLQNFSMETTDQDWKPSVHNAAENVFCKLIRLDNLFGYWNVNSKMFHKYGVYKKSLESLKNGVVHENIIPADYDIVFRPISAQAKLRMNHRADFDFSAPKMDLDFRLQDIGIELNKLQYFSIMELLESVDMMTQNLPYRKYRPDVRVHQNAKKWWKYAITGVLKVNVEPRLRMWSWKHICEHRQNMKQYKELYKRKIRNKKPTNEVLRSLQHLEKVLDVFNIILARQQAEVEIKKAGLKIYESSGEESRGWFAWLWGWSESPSSDEQAEAKPAGLEEYMTSEEKAKLYEAIGYSETIVDPTLPKTYEAKKLSLRLDSMHISLRENQKKSELVLISLGEFSTLIIQRPGAQAIKFESKIDSFQITGSSSYDSKPCLLCPLDDSSSLFKIMFETNPLDGSAAQRCIVEAEALEMIYDAKTVNAIVEFFRPPKEVHLAQLTTATLMKLEEFREKTSTGLLYVIETQKILDLKINVKASYIIIPQKGFYTAASNILLLDLGHLKVSSRSRSELPQIEICQTNIEEIMSRAYDYFDVQLSSIQLLFSTPGDNWKEARKLKSSRQHILEPLHFNVELSKSMVVTDIRMPKFKVFGHLPLLSLQVSDKKLRGILQLIKSIPIPQSRTDVPTLPRTSLIRVSSSFGTPQISQKLLPLWELHSIIEDESEEEFFDAPCSPLEEAPCMTLNTSFILRPRRSQRQELTNLIDFTVKFEIPEVLIQCYRLIKNLEQPMVELDILGLGTEIQSRRFDMRASAYLKEICLKCPEYQDEKGKPVYIVTTLDNTVEDLLTLEYVKADRHGPDLKTIYKNVEQLIKVNFSSLDIHLHTEALLSIMNFINNLLPGREVKSFSESQIVGNEDKGEIMKKSTSKISRTEDIITLKVIAELSHLCIYIEDQRCRIAEITIEGFDSQVIVRRAITEVNVNLKNIIILDSDETALYKKVLYITGKEVFSFKMVSYLGATAGAEYMNMNVVDSEVTLTVGCIEVVLIMKFLYSVMAFINNFQRAKEALTEATVQATGIAGGVKELAKRSSRMALDIHIKAPVVVIPQSSASENVLVADFGLITMKNKFYMVSKSNFNPPPVIDDITVKLSEMKLYRSQFVEGQFPEVIDIMQPINLEVTVQRNLSWEWYREIPAMNLDAQLKPMELILSQEDMTMIVKMLYENIWIEDTNLSVTTVTEESSVVSDLTSPRLSGGTTLVTAAVVEMHSEAPRVKTTLNLNFRTDYMTLTVYSPDPQNISFVDVRNPLLKLAQFKLEQILSVGKMFTDDSVFFSLSLKHCILEDKQSHTQKATPQMIGLTVGFERKDMMDIQYKRNKDGVVVDVILQELYLCASIEFLKAVADVFLTAYYSGIVMETASVQQWSSKEVQSDIEEKWEMNILIKNPEIVFVADLSRHDAPSLVLTTQCEICCKWSLFSETVTAAIKDLQVKACPFLPGKREGKVATVLQPCDLFYQSIQSGKEPQMVDISVKALTLKISPIIINTVITIMSAFYKTVEVKHRESFPSQPDLWDKMDTKTLKMWFLEESSDNENVAAVTELVPNGETIKMTIDSIFVVLEAGVGHRTVPMLLAKSYFSGEGKNWSTLINLHCHLELEVHYFNEMFGVWEPLLEPLEIDQTEDFRPWNLGIKIKKKARKALVESETEEENYKVPEYKTVISFYSKDQLNITLSKCGLVMLNNLGKAFAEAAVQTSDVFTKDQAPFMISNSLGISISVSMSDSFRVLNVPVAKTFELKNEQSLSMDYVRSHDGDQFSAMTSLSSKLFFILLTPENHSTAEKIPLTKVGRRLYTVRHRESGVERSIVCQIDTIEGSKKVTVRSPVQMRNHFLVPLNVYEGDTLLGTALPENEFNVPLTSYRSAIVLKPDGEEYEPCDAINFEEIVKHEGLLLERRCRASYSAKKAFIINIVPEKDKLTSMSAYSDDGWDLPYIIHLWPPVLLRNFLPYKIAYYLEGNELRVFTLTEGCSTQICTAELDDTRLHLKLIDYLDQDWKSEYQIRSNQHDISFISFVCVTEIEKTELVIAIHLTYSTGQTIVAFHSPYWMVNKTGRMLQYKADGIHRKHPPDYKKPVLFSFQPKHFFNNNKVQLMVTDSELSDQFSIDTVGSHGAVKCKGMTMEYQVGVTIDLSSFNLTRIVTFTPFYIINNKSRYNVKVSEEGKEKWISLDLEQCIPFWPETTSNKLLIQVENSEDPPKKIHLNKQENCILLNLGNKLGGIIVQVNMAEHSVVITFMDYHDGSATFLLINHTKDEMVEYKQSCLSEMEDMLPPGKAVLYTWSDPIGSRKLTWKCGKSRGEVTQKDDMMTPINLGGKKTIYLVSFFEGLQRIILFTEDPKVFKVTYESEKAELAEQEIVLSLQDVGISLVNNYTKQEVAYIGITSSDVVWETKPKKKARWRPLSVKQTEKLEKEFKEYIEISPSEDKIIELETNVSVYLTPSGSNMKILQPHVIPVRRNYLPAVKLEYSTSAHQTSFRIQIYRIQIQNQIHGAIFPFVFYPIKPPKSVTMDSAPKPFTDVSIVMRTAGHSQISRIKYFKVLIQEMDLRLDLGFLYALADLMSGAEVMEKHEVEVFHQDIEYFEEGFKTDSLTDITQVSLYEYFHISPIKLHLSVSLSSGRDDTKHTTHEGGLIPVHSINLLLKSIGATLTDVQDVVFKLAFFELNYQFHTTPQLRSEVIRHYSKQAIKQMYVLILGLEVLGNPFGLIREFSEGVEAFFYEPYQGAIQGPEEFVEGMALGLKALVGGAVGGLAGAASKITNAMAKGVAAMTMDEDYQQKRREAMNRQPAGLREGITRGGKGLVSGFVSGITGIVTKPIKGAQKEGAAGFFKGVGKGLVGAVARPTGGIIDMASSTFQGIKRATETSDEVESLRPPRFFNEDGVIRPYRLRDGTGNQMLQKFYAYREWIMTLSSSSSDDDED